MRFWRIALILMMCSISPAKAQVNMSADSMLVSGENLLVISGNVEILYEGVRLTASQVYYNRATNTLRISGPITLHEGTEIIIIAESAQLGRGDHHCQKYRAGAASGCGG